MNTIIATFGSYAELEKFFNENKSKFYCDELKREELFYGYQNPEPLLLENVTELVVKFTVKEQKNWKGEFDYWYVEDFAARYIKNVKTGKLYHFHSDNHGKKNFLTLVVENDSRDNNFEFSEPEPNKIGKATEKKLQAWFDFLDRKEIARQEYMNANSDKRAKYIAEIEKVGEIKWDNNSKTRGRVVSKYFTLEVEVTLDGYCHKEIKFNSYSSQYDLDLFAVLAKL